MPQRISFIATCVVLGAVTTFAVAWSFVLWLPMEDGRGTVALDGDHLQPWLIGVHRLGSDRLIWFEKGRIWSRPGVGPPGGSSAAVSCWSFATSTRSNLRFRRAAIEVPANLRAEIDRSPPQMWGLADDRRGWPLPALRCVVYGVTDPNAPHIFQSSSAILFHPQSNMGAESLVAIRPLPFEPLWGGFLTNSALAGGMWWVVLWCGGLLLGAIRARFRVPAGLCPHCAYDLQATGGPESGCPECGWNRKPAAP